MAISGADNIPRSLSQTDVWIAYFPVICLTSGVSAFPAGDTRDMNNRLIERLFDVALWLAGAGHFVILIASAQVPSRLNWKEDLRQLLPFNRKLLWVQSGFTVLRSSRLDR